MKRALKAATLTIVFFFLHASTYALGILGGEITYKYLGGTKYLIGAKIYRDNEFSMDSVLTVRFYASSKFESCESYGVLYKTSSNETGIGMEEQYEDTFSLYTVSDSCSRIDVMIDFLKYRKNYEINTFVSTGFMYLASTINVRLKHMNNDTYLGLSQKNSSPIFFGEPIVDFCFNQPVHLSIAAFDTIDHDSLSYELVSAKNYYRTVPTDVRYLTGFSYLAPLTTYCLDTLNCKVDPNANPPHGFYFDKSKGIIVFTPTKKNQVSAIVVKVNEYRKNIYGQWVYLGGISREFIVYVNDCKNYVPEISGADYVRACPGDKVCFKIKATDQTFKLENPDTVQLSWINPIKNSTITILDTLAREKEAEFCWQTTANDAAQMPYSFTVIAKDNDDLYKYTANKTFRILVKGPEFSLGDDFKMEDNQKRSFGGPKGNFRYLWFDNSTEQSLVYVATEYDTGKKAIWLRITDTVRNCSFTDTLILSITHSKVGILTFSDAGIKMFPNPANNQVIFQGLPLNANIAIYDCTGKCVSRFSFSGEFEEKKINIGDLSQGVYTVQVEPNKQKIRTKLVKN